MSPKKGDKEDPPAGKPEPGASPPCDLPAEGTLAEGSGPDDSMRKGPPDSMHKGPPDSMHKGPPDSMCKGPGGPPDGMLKGPPDGMLKGPPDGMPEMNDDPDGAPMEMMPMDGMPMVGMMDMEDGFDGPPTDVPYRKLFYWGWEVVSTCRWPFIFVTLWNILADVFTQYNVQVLTVVVGGLQGGPKGGGGDGFLSALLPTDVRTAAMAFAAIGVALIAARLLERVLKAWTDNVMLGRLQQRLHDRLMTLGPTYHQAHDTSETMLIVKNYAGGAQMLLSDLISSPLVQGISLVSSLVFLYNNLVKLKDTPLWIEASLLVTLLFLPVMGWWLAGRLRAAFTLVRDRETEVANEFFNSSSLPLEVQLLGAQQQRREAFAGAVKRYIDAMVRASLRNEVATQFQSSTPVVLQLLFLLYGVFVALSTGDGTAAGAILGIFYFVPAAVAPIQQLIMFVTGLNTAWPQVEKVVEVLEAEPDVEDRPGAEDLAADRTVKLDKVDFSYVEGGVKILDQLSHTFEAGKVTAIVGRAGSGKSSLLNLVARIRDPDAGSISIGEQDIRDVKLSSLRRKFSKVSQFPLFIVDTIRANLKLARADATDAELQKVCERTGIWPVLERAAGPGEAPLDNVLPRAVSEGLSGGQRRLLAVTRGLLWQPSILLLDEPTTGIDALGRAQLVEVLEQASEDVTVLLVDHDMEFVSRVADVICCLDGGKFVDVGSPEELAARPSLYASLLEASESEEGA